MSQCNCEWIDLQLPNNISTITATCTHLLAMSVFPSPTLGGAIPPNTPHSILFSLPTWEDVVQIVKGNKIPSLETTYPRFLIHMLVKQVRRIH